jgi:hypothetical protein
VAGRDEKPGEIACQGFWSGGPHTDSAARPPGVAPGARLGKGRSGVAERPAFVVTDELLEASGSSGCGMVPCKMLCVLPLPAGVPEPLTSRKGPSGPADCRRSPTKPLQDSVRRALPLDDDAFDRTLAHLWSTS